MLDKNEEEEELFYNDIHNNCEPILISIPLPGRRRDLHVAMAPVHKCMTDINNILQRHCYINVVHNELVGLLKRHKRGQKLNFSVGALRNKSSFMKEMEKTLQTKHMFPKDVPVNFASGVVATTTVYLVEEMILDILLGKELMKVKSLADGYNYLTGMATKPRTNYSEVHTGDAWEPACHYFCGDKPRHFSIAMLVFADNSHYDQKGVLFFTQ